MTKANEIHQEPPNTYRGSDYLEDEVELIDYLRVIWKWKWLVVGGTLICAIIAAVISFQMPEIYEISMAIKPDMGSIYYKVRPPMLSEDPSANVSGRINEGIYSKRIEEALQPDSMKTGVNFKAVIRGTKIVRITAQWKKEDIALGMKATNHLLRFLSDGEQDTEQVKADYDKLLYIKQNELNQLETRIEFLRESLKFTKHRMEVLKKETDSVKINTKDLIKQRNLLLKENKAEIEIRLIFYSTIIPQNRTYLIQINDQIYHFMEKEKEDLREIEDIKGDINIAEAEMASLNKIKEINSAIVILQAPEISKHPVKSKKKQIILLSGAVGFIFFLFLSFFIEYIKKHQNIMGR